MNIFRLQGDLSHLLAIVVLLLKIWKTRSCAGISGKSQILFAVVYTTRYLDLLTTFISPYNTVMKVIFIGASYATIYLMYIKFKATYDYNHDTFWIELLLIPAVTLALLINHEYTVLEVLWTFSIYLESVAILPQLILVFKTGEAESITLLYLFALGSYRALYLLNWIYRYYSENHYDLIAIVAGVVQTVLYCDFFYLYFTKDSSSIHSDEDPYDELDKPAAPKFEGSAFNTMRAADLYRPAVNHGGPQTPASPTGPGNAYCPSLTSASLYSALPCKLDWVESLYGGTKSPPLTRANLNRSQYVYSKVPPAPMCSRDGLPRPGPLVPAQSLYPMRFSQNDNTTNQNVQNQQNQLQQRSESMYGVRGITSVNRGETDGVNGVSHGNAATNTAAGKFGGGRNRPESVYGMVANRRQDSADSSYSSYHSSGNGGVRPGNGNFLGGNKCGGPPQVFSLTRNDLRQSPQTPQHQLLSPGPTSVVNTTNSVASHHHSQRLSPNPQY